MFHQLQGSQACFPSPHPPCRPEIQLQSRSKKLNKHCHQTFLGYSGQKLWSKYITGEKKTNIWEQDDCLAHPPIASGGAYGAKSGFNETRAPQQQCIMSIQALLKKNKTTKKTKISIDVHQYGINIDFLTDFCLKNKLTQSNVSSDQDWRLIPFKRVCLCRWPSQRHPNWCSWYVLFMCMPSIFFPYSRLIPQSSS